MNRVVICARGYPPDLAGGGEISTKLIAGGLKRLGLDVQVLTFTDGESRVEKIEDVKVHRLHCPNIYWSIKASEQPRWKKSLWHLSQALRWTPPKSIRESILRLQPSILHTSTIEDFGPSLWRWARSRGMKTIHSLRSYNLLHHKGTLYDAQRDCEIGPDLLSVPKRAYARSLDGVIGISDCILNKHLQSGFFRDSKMTVIGNPIDQPIANIAARGVLPLRLGILGRVAPEKGIEPFLQSLKQLREAPSWALDIAGEGSNPYVALLRQLATDLPVRFVGWKSSREFLSSLDLLVVPSRWDEPFGRIIVEAYSVGLPVLCLRRGAMPELVEEGRTGWIVDLWETTSIENALRKCGQLDRSYIRSAAEKYTVDRVANLHLDFYKEVGQFV